VYLSPYKGRPILNRILWVNPNPLSLLSGLTTLIGIALALLFKESVKKVVIGIGFSAGIMLLISFLDLIPESVNATGIVNSSVFVFLGVLMIGSLNFIIPHIHLTRERKAIRRELKAAYLIAFGLILHDFPEGFAMANSYRGF
jgi:ZIP family zinc transporter